MPNFRYKAMTASGAIVRGRLEAPSEAVVIRHVRSEGHYPISTSTDLVSGIFERLQKGLSGPTSLRDLSTTTRELSDLLLAGLELDRVLGVMINLRGSDSLRQSFSDVRAKVRDGSTLADALAQNPVFPKFYVGMVRAGEMGGVLAPTLRKLADYLDRSLETRESILSALVYPAILVVTAGISVSFILTFVIPSFAPLFASAGQTLPLPTRIAMDLSWALRTFWWLGFLLVAGGVFWFKRAMAQQAFRRKWDAGMLGLPLIGTLIVDIELEQFKRMLGTLTASGVPLPTALALSRDVIRNAEIAAVVQDAAVSLREGDSLARRLSRSAFFPPATLDLLRIGEETGKLDDMLIRQSDLDERRIRHQIDRLMALLVPAITIVLGIIVAALIASMLVAILSVNNVAFQ